MICRGRLDSGGVVLDCGDSAMSQSAKAQEPSMEEILASIRRIIADDDNTKPASPKPVPVSAAPPPPRPAAMPPRNPVPPSPPAAGHAARRDGSARHRRHAGGPRWAAGPDRTAAGRGARTDRADGGSGRHRDAELPDHRRSVRRDLFRRTGRPGPAAATARRRGVPHRRAARARCCRNPACSIAR